MPRNRLHPDQMWLDFEPNPLQLMSPDDIYDSANLELLTKLQEDNRLERKPASFSGDSLGEYFSMWANTSPDGGLIVSGQANGGLFEGLCSLTPESLNKREQTGHTFCPDAAYKSKRVAVVNKKGEKDFVILFRIYYNPDNVVRTTNGKVFKRIGDSCVELKAEEIRELQADKGQISFEKQPCGLDWPNDFDSESLDQYIKKVRSKRNMPEALTDEEVLELRRLGKIKSGIFKPNYACALLFAKDPGDLVPGCKIKFTRFEGEVEKTGAEYNSVKEMFLEGSVPSLILQAEEVLESQLRTFAPLDKKLKFHPIPEYPKFAWYEAIVNACVHRSYGNGLRNMPIFIKMFDNHLVIESPGAFLPGVTGENIYTQHQPRNPRLMDAMYYMEYVRCAHEGTQRIRDSMSQLELPPPDFRQAAQGPVTVCVTLRNNVKQRRAWIDHDVSKITSAAIAAAFSENERQVLNLVAANGKLTISDASKMLHVSWQRAKKLLLGLAVKQVLQLVRFKTWKKDLRDPKAYFRLNNEETLPEGAAIQEVTAERLKKLKE